MRFALIKSKRMLGYAPMKTKRNWALWGLLAGVLLGLGDYGLFQFLGVDMQLSGRTVTEEISLLLTLTYAGMGFVIGKLREARTQARADAHTIAEQLAALEASKQAALQNEKLAALGRLAAGIAHEVRNPLGVIRASASMVQEHFSADEEAYRACEFIREETDRLNGLITSLLSLSRPADLRLQPVALEAVIDRALQLAAEELRQHDIRVQRLTQGPTYDFPQVTADPDLIAQVLLGLVVNAVEAIGHQGQICIQTAHTTDSVSIEITDSGPGIRAEDAQHVFEPFFTTKPSGTGLGLPMAQRIIRTHGGSIELVASQPNGRNVSGACFRLQLPIPGPVAGSVTSPVTGQEASV